MAGLFSVALSMGAGDCQSPCGNGTLDTNETCDDGRQCDNGVACTGDTQCVGIGDALCLTRSCDGCTAGCRLETGCGDGVICGAETCDDGNTDNCTGNCNPTCTGPGNTCGDGTLACGEPCDDGNTVSGDGCTASCVREPVLGSVSSIIFSPVAAGKTAGPVAGVSTRWFTNDRQTRLTQAIVAVSQVLTSDTLVLNVTVNGQTRSGALDWVTGSTWQMATASIGDFNLAGGDNAVTFTVRRTNTPAATSNTFPSGAQTPRVVESAWAEITAVAPPLSAGGYLTRDDFFVNGVANRNDLNFRVRRDTGPDIVLPASTPGLYGARITGGAWNGLYPVLNIPVDGGGHETRVGFERPGHANLEVLSQPYTLDPDIILVPVVAWIVLAPGDSPGNPTNNGSPISVNQAQRYFDPVFVPGSISLPILNDANMVDVLWSQANIQFHIIDRNADLHVTYAPTLALAMNPVGWGGGTTCTACATCNADPAPPGGLNCTDCEYVEDPPGSATFDWHCEDCLGGGNNECSQCTGCTGTVIDDYYVHCCNQGYIGQNGPVESGHALGECCLGLPPIQSSCPNALYTDGDWYPCVWNGVDIGAALGRADKTANVYFVQNFIGVGGHADRIPQSYRAGVYLSESCGSRWCLSHEFGHFMGLSHICNRIEFNTGVVECRDRITSLSCSPPAGGGCQTVPATLGSPPYGRTFTGSGSDTCLANDSICFINEPASNGPVDCDTTYPDFIMNRARCGDGDLLNQSFMYEVSIARQTIINSCVAGIDPGSNAVGDLNCPMDATCICAP